MGRMQSLRDEIMFSVLVGEARFANSWGKICIRLHRKRLQTKIQLSSKQHTFYSMIFGYCNFTSVSCPCDKNEALDFTCKSSIATCSTLLTDEINDHEIVIKLYTDPLTVGSLALSKGSSFLATAFPGA